MLRRLLLLPLLLVATGCATGPRGYRHPAVRDLLVITESEAAQLELTPAPLARSFERGRDSSAVLSSFLRTARAEGAAYVSSIAVHLVVADENGPVECITRIGPREEIETRWHTVSTPGHMEYQSKLKPVTETRTTYERECHTVRRPHTVSKTEYTTEYDYSKHTSRRVARTRMVTEYRSEQDCRSVPRTRTTTRYEYQRESHWVPPKLEVVSRRYSRWELVESQPMCQPLAPGASTSNLIEAQIYLPAKPAPAATP